MEAMPALPWRLLHLLSLATLAITQPLLGILGDNPTFFTAHDSSPTQVVALALAVALVPAALLGAVETVIQLVRPRLTAPVHLAFVGLLGFLALIQVVDVAPGPWVVPVVLGLALTGGLVRWYAISEAVRSVASVLAFTPVLFVGVFVFVSPASAVVFPDDVEAVELAELVGGGLALDLGPQDTTATETARPLTIAEQVEQRFPPIHLLIFDELPMASLLDETGEIDRARWPNFARLGDMSHLFSNATTVGSTTEVAVPAMLTGRTAAEAAPVYSLYPENLFTLLGDIYDVSSSDPLVDLCPPTVCDGAPPEAILELLATPTPVDATSTTMPPTTTSTSVATGSPVVADGPSAERGSFRLLFDDAMIVFGHLVAPEGLDLGLPSIGAGWGNFGGDLTIDEPDGGPAPATDITTTTAPARTTTAPPPTTAPVEVEVGRVPVGDVVEVDAQAVTAENTAFLDSLITNDARVADFRAEVAAMRAADTPRLHYLHTLLPHVPWRLHPGGETYVDVYLAGYFSRWDGDETSARASQQRHLLQLAFADRLLGEYLDQLEREGVLDRATVIVSADHGISFLPGHPTRGVDSENLGGVAGVPLFYKLPGQTSGVRHHKPVETIDIVPTIAAQLGIDIPWTVDGHDLFGPEVDRERGVLHPYAAPIVEPFQPQMDAVTDDLLATFGNGTTGNLYGLAGLHDRIGTPVDDLYDRPTACCWAREDRAAIDDEPDATGFVYGRLWTARAERIPVALTAGDVLTGTSVTLERFAAHQVYALGDPAFWIADAADDIGLHEIVEGRLRPIPLC